MEALAAERKKAPKSPPMMGCAYHDRCPLVDTLCMGSAPHLRRVGGEHFAACHFVGDSRR